MLNLINKITHNELVEYIFSVYKEEDKQKYTNLFSFLTEEYNDFLIAHTPADQNNSMVYHFLLGANGIEDEDGNPIEKSKEEDFVEEDIKFFNEISTKNPYLNDNYNSSFLDKSYQKSYYFLH